MKKQIIVRIVINATFIAGGSEQVGSARRASHAASHPRGTAKPSLDLSYAD